MPKVKILLIKSKRSFLEYFYVKKNKSRLQSMLQLLLFKSSGQYISDFCIHLKIHTLWYKKHFLFWLFFC